MIAVIDNYDSFTYNLVQYLGELGARCRSSATTQITRGRTGGAATPATSSSRPGRATPATPASPTRSSASLGPRSPLLGVCLGHQCIGAGLRRAGGCARRA